MILLSVIFISGLHYSGFVQASDFDSLIHNMYEQTSSIRSILQFDFFTGGCVPMIFPDGFITTDWCFKDHYDTHITDGFEDNCGLLEILNFRPFGEK